LFLLFPLIILSLSCLGQYRTDISNAVAKLNQDNFNDQVKGIDYGQIEGNPFLEKEFKPAVIIKNDGTEIRDFLLRYNVYKNSMEFKQKEIVLYIADPSSISKIILDHRTFVYASYTDSRKIRLSYLQLLVDGKYQLLKKYNTVYNPGEPKSNKSQMFEELQPGFYLRYKNGMAHEIHSKKELIKILQPISSEITSYIQQTKINFRNEIELANTITYINRSDD